MATVIVAVVLIIIGGVIGSVGAIRSDVSFVDLLLIGFGFLVIGSAIDMLRDWMG